MAFNNKQVKIEVVEGAQGAPPSDLGPAADYSVAGLMDMLGDDMVEEVGCSAQASEEKGRGVMRPKPETDDDAGRPSPKAPRVVKREEDSATAGVAPASSNDQLVFVSPVKRRVKGAPLCNSAGGSEPQCYGCRRIRGVSPCFLKAGEHCIWAEKSGRGNWCRDCHTTWRTNYMETQALAYFGAFLDRDPVNRREFEEALLATLSLSAQQIGNITGALVQQRVRLLRWVWRAVDFNPFYGGASPSGHSFIATWLSRLEGALPAEQQQPVVEDAASPADAVGASPTKAPLGKIAKKVKGGYPRCHEAARCFRRGRLA